MIPDKHHAVPGEPVVRTRRTVAREELDALTAPPSPIDLELLASMPTLPLRARYLVNGYLTGRHASLVKGTAPEFAEYRTYQCGDDLRRLDWRLYARSDRLVVKQFQDENQLQITLALDLSASLRYASRPKTMTKLDVARTALAAVALLARRQNDAIGVALFGDREGDDGAVLDYLRHSASVAHYHTVLDKLEVVPAVDTASVVRGLQSVAMLARNGGLVVVASDFYDDLEAIADTLRLLRARRLDVIGIQVLDPMEVEFAIDTAGRFVDLETGGYLPLNSAAVRAGYLERFSAFRRQLAEVFREHDAELVPLQTDKSPLPVLAAYLARRARLV